MTYRYREEGKLNFEAAKEAATKHPDVPAARQTPCSLLACAQVKKLTSAMKVFLKE
jgi:hypothetical protein